MIDLAVVMPVYNEEECIADVVRSWREELQHLGINFHLIVLNDGSKDGTAAALRGFDGDARVSIVTKSNSGHGPTILEGYKMAVARAEWVFQCDSDDEMKPSRFEALWSRRDRYDALFGMRHGRQQNAGRGFISLISRLTIGLLFGRGVRDVNVPYRLMRSDILRQILPQIPADTFAPNIIIAGSMARARLRLLNVPVPHEGRRTGTASIVKWKLWKAAFKSFLQTLRCKPKVQRVARKRAA